MGVLELILVAFIVMKVLGVASVAAISWGIIFGSYVMAYAVMTVLAVVGFFLFRLLAR